MKTTPLSAAILLLCSLPAQEMPSRRDLPPSVPAAAISPAAEVLFDRPVVGGPLWAMGHDWKASFDGRGLTFIPFFGSDAPRNFPVRVEVTRATVGEQALAMTDGEPIATGNTVRTERGGFTELVHTDLRAVEQSWVFATLPVRGAIVVELSMASELAASPTADGLVFQNEFGSVAYHEAVAFDAAGARLPLTIGWNAGRARIEIPAAFVDRARLPLVLDPVFNNNGGLAPGITQLQREPDVATLGSDRTCVVWRRQYSATDMDVWATILDANLVAATTTVSIDFTSLSWSAPAVASSTFAQKFLVVSQVDSGAASWISGRMVDAFGITAPQFDIERSGVVGLPGNKFRPDVGGDPYYGVAAYFTVVYEEEPLPGASRDIWFKQVNQDGTLRTTLPIVLMATALHETNPSISKSNRTENWCVAFQRSAGSALENIYAAEISWWGSLAVAPYFVAGTGVDETMPDVSSPAILGGVRHFLIAYQRNSFGNNNILCDIRATGGTPVASFDLSATEASGAYQGWNQILPEVDSDGVRFVVGYTEQWQGLYDHDTRVSTISYSPNTFTLTIDDERVLLNGTASEDRWTRIASDAGSSSAPSPRYKIVCAKFSSNDIQVLDYGGHAPGPLFLTRPTQCGTLSMTASGTPAIGNPVTFTVANGSLSGTLVGFPGTIPLLSVLGCNCTLGVVNGFFMPNPFSWTIPADPASIGTTVSVQGWTIIGSQCLGAVDLSDTIDFTIR